MKKIFLVMLGLLVVFMFLVGCTPTEEISDEELEAELSELSAEELDQAIETVESEDTSALAGQAYKKTLTIPRNIPKDKFLKTAYKMKLKRILKPIVPTELPICCCDHDEHYCQLLPNDECNNAKYPDSNTEFECKKEIEDHLMGYDFYEESELPICCCDHDEHYCQLLPDDECNNAKYPGINTEFGCKKEIKEHLIGYDFYE
ncbi:hypothetical protein HOE37_05670 [Candidatus Woesearchaeota archaeon]|jgi:hypothetical protein|nr:hypothetical protein [Candidatus Woesearchaeota archaeon]MBT4336500.1 hypothetical protein [Candidatus Woesearchaeota archaeon]MBT4469913.1 hypothetical protein [Candidatus Woesearchaeota archaeon]MBT6744416.1 hypothetical protein [Candidatus Woesearchaeota archaeon]